MMIVHYNLLYYLRKIINYTGKKIIYTEQLHSTHTKQYVSIHREASIYLHKTLDISRVDNILLYREATLREVQLYIFVANTNKAP